MIKEHGIGKRTPVGAAIVLVVLVLFAIWTLFPVVWAAITSFKEPGDSFKATFIPYKQFKPTVYAWKDAFVTTRDRTLRSLQNSIVISSFSSAVVLILGAFAGYSLARYEFRKWETRTSPSPSRRRSSTSQRSNGSRHWRSSVVRRIAGGGPFSLSST